MTDVWHLPSETPDVFRVWQVLVIYEAGDQREFMASNEFSWRTANRYVNRWCYVDDLIKENDRTRKALKIAVDALDRMAIHDSIYDIIARNAMKRIKELEQKEQQ